MGPPGINSVVTIKGPTINQSVIADYWDQVRRQHDSTH